MQKTLMIIALLLPTIALAERITVDLASAENSTATGQVVIEDSPLGGILITPHLSGLPAGVHGFHVHAMPSCADHANGAGAHLDPAQTNIHAGPYGNGHLGDLPVLIVDADGTATLPVLAPRLTVADVTGHALMIHAGGDNYHDLPKPLGGGGARIACGVISK